MISFFSSKRYIFVEKNRHISHAGGFSPNLIFKKEGTQKDLTYGSSLILSDGAREVSDSQLHTSDTEKMINLAECLKVFVMDRESENGLAGMIDDHPGDIDQPVAKLLDP